MVISLFLLGSIVVFAAVSSCLVIDYGYYCFLFSWFVCLLVGFCLFVVCFVCRLLFVCFV